MSYVRISPAGEKLNEHVRQLQKNNDLAVFSVLEYHCVLELPTGKYLTIFKNPILHLYNYYYRKACQKRLCGIFFQYLL